MTEALIVIGAISIIIYISSTIRIYSFLKVKGEELVSFLFINIYVFKYLNRYKEITSEESGAGGPIYSKWLVSVNVGAICFILYLFFGDKY